MTEPDTQHAILVVRFCIWAQSLRDCEGIPFVTPEIRAWIEAADKEIMDLHAQANERRKLAKRTGKLGGRPTTDNPKPSTIRARKSRAKKAKKKGRE